MEDAALLRPQEGGGLVFTVDFITPIVDEPEDFGAIAAANSLSDVYAMGGEPQVALAICGSPGEKVPLELLGRIFRGARDQAALAGCAIVGGHTVVDPELKYGLCVLGSVDPERALTQDRARAGDRLVLSKPLGTGIAAQAARAGGLEPEELAVAIAWMRRLNREASRAALACGARAATDVTGFGLLGHLHHLARASGVAARVVADRVPVLPFARAHAGAGRVPGGTRRNLAYVEPHLTARGVDEADLLVLADAQTSGGLLIAVPADRTAALVAELERTEAAVAAEVGELVPGAPGAIEVIGG